MTKKQLAALIATAIVSIYGATYLEHEHHGKWWADATGVVLLIAFGFCAVAAIFGVMDRIKSKESEK